jgi:hypothetical protein
VIKELINTLSAPVYSFTAVLILFSVGFKYYRVVGTKKLGYISLGIFSLFSLFFLSDDNFYKIITTPDNIPIVMLIMSVGFFTWYAIYKAAANDLRIESGLGPVEAQEEEREKIWVWPNLVYIELIAMVAFSVFLIVWAILVPAPLEESANPTWAPNPAKAPWYFLGLQEMLVYFDAWMAGVVLPGIIVVGLILIPYIDTNPNGNGYYTFKERKRAIFMFLFGWIVLWVYLILIGTFLRGPNWTFFGPFEVWDVHKVVAASNINLSEYFWILGLGTSMPQNIFLREFLGILMLILYLTIPVILVTNKWGKELLNKMGPMRYYIMIFLVLGMMSLPVKMYLRWFFNLKYIIAMPEFELNL